MNFDFSTANQILFGCGVLEKVGTTAAALGKKALLVIGRKGMDISNLENYLLAGGLEWSEYYIDGEPTIDTIDQGKSTAISQGCDMVIGFGGGSAIDTAKAVAAMLTNSGNLRDYLEVVGKNLTLQKQPAPFIAIPTTSGTGSEVTRNSVVTAPSERVKVSLRSPMMLARVAIIDPLLTVEMPKPITASTGMDALAQVIEPFVSKRANSITDLFCISGIQRGAKSLLNAYQNGSDVNAREDMSFTSLMGGLALANAGLGAVHGFAGPIGGMFNAPHGAVCACLLPPVVEANVRALREREPTNPALERYHEIARLITGRNNATVKDLSKWLDDLRLVLEIPRLGEFGIRSEDISLIVEKSAVASSMKANPITLFPDELSEILEQAM